MDRAWAGNNSIAYLAPHTIVEKLTRQSVILSLLAIFLFYLIHVRYNTHLRTIPGPFLASLTRLWKVKTILTARQELVLLDLHRKYGNDCSIPA